jgi:predicted transcriptional regulator
MLQSLGLSPVDQALYEFLLPRPAVGEEELGGVAAERGWGAEADRALRRLIELGLVTRLPEEPPRYVVVPADAALHVLVAARERAMAAARQRIAQLAARHRRAAGVRDAHELVEVVYGREAVLSRALEVFRSARAEVRMFDAPPYLDDRLPTNPMEVEQLNRGVRQRTIYDRQGVAVSRLPHIDHSIAAGEQARVADVPIKMVLSDHPLALLPLRSNPMDPEVSLLVRAPMLLDALGALFETYWERAVPLHTAGSAGAANDHDRPDETDRSLLWLLAAGLGTEAIAAQMGWHPSTTTRRLRRLLRRLDATTRFQAGYQAVRRGWLGNDPLPLS